MDLMRYDTLFFYYALTRIERRTMSQPRATYIKLLLIAFLYKYNRLQYYVKSNIGGGMNENEPGYPEI